MGKIPGRVSSALALFGTAFFLGSCGEQPTEPGSSIRSLRPQSAAILISSFKPEGRLHPSRFGRLVPFSTINRYDQSAFLRPYVLVVRSESEWKSAMDRIVEAGGAIAPEAVPQIDWEKNAAILISMGERLGSGHDVRINGVRRSLGATYVSVHVEYPEGPRDHLFAYPAHSIAVARRDLKGLIFLLDQEIDGLTYLGEGAPPDR